MHDDIMERISRDARYTDLVMRRSRFGWTMSAVMFASFVGFTILVAFKKDWLATPIGDGVTSIGMPIGLGLIAFAVLLTGIYVVRANIVYDRQMADILRDAHS